MMKNRWMKWIAAALAVVLCTGMLTGCSSSDQAYNLMKPKNGDTIAVLHTSMGDITVEFFKKAAPKAVENFLTHAEEGYYNDMIFHRVISDFMIQSGDPAGTGTGGESIWGTPFELEISDRAFNLRGALCMANAGPNTNGSQFYIVQEGIVDDQLFKMYEMYGYTFTDQQKELYSTYGGSPWLDGDYTVFGQVIEGMDIVDAIAAVQVDEQDKPLEDVVLKSIEVTKYSADK